MLGSLLTGSYLVVDNVTWMLVAGRMLPECWLLVVCYRDVGCWSVG